MHQFRILSPVEGLLGFPLLRVLSQACAEHSRSIEGLLTAEGGLRA
jgi:hypothetical protein